MSTASRICQTSSLDQFLGLRRLECLEAEECSSRHSTDRPTMIPCSAFPLSLPPTPPTRAHIHSPRAETERPVLRLHRQQSRPPAVPQSQAQLRGIVAQLIVFNGARRQVSGNNQAHRRSSRRIRVLMQQDMRQDSLRSSTFEV